MPAPNTLSADLREFASNLEQGDPHVADDRDLLHRAAARLEVLEAEVRRLERQRHPLFRVSESMAAAVARSMNASRPIEFEDRDLRRFVLSWHDWDGAPPAPGSFVVVGHGVAAGAAAMAAYRVYGFDRLAIGGRLATLEPIDPHEVPLLAHVRELPRPLQDVTDWDEDDERLETLEGEALDVALCSSSYPPADQPGALAVCERFHEHPGEHLGRTDEGRELVWETGAPGESGGVEPRAVPADSPEANRAREREGVSAWTS